ncbi:MAG: 30S ribosomal protein S27e [Nanoarchaeota archaeon]
MAEQKGKFLKIACPRCKQKQIVFGKSSMQIKCSKCNHLLTRTRGGKTKIKAIVKEVLWN